MIYRTWRGWTAPEGAEAFTAFFTATVAPGIRAIPGCRGVRLLRRPAGAEVEFMTITLWDSMQSVRAFAGDDPETAVVPPGARALLARFDPATLHYEAIELGDAK